MSRPTISRLLAPLSRTVCPTTTTATTVPQWTRLFSQSRAVNAGDAGPRKPPAPLAQAQAQAPNSNPMDSLVKNVMSSALRPAEMGKNLGDDLGLPENPDAKGDEPYHMHVLSHKHNTHITVTKPNRDALISLSCGNLGFRKSNRKHYDSAYQLGAYVIDKMHQKGLVKDIHKLEVVLRGFGAGREAVVKVLMGNEGKELRKKITRLSDATRLKFGGTRSPRIRRLG